ncbi:MAG: glycosyltransferase family 39 protein [Thermacetogeniaceae bacterium]
MPRKNAFAGFLFALVFAAAASGFWLAYCRSAFQGLFLNDAQDYASIARNIALGRGFLSQYVTPLGLAHHGVPQPDLWRAPLWPILLAAFQKAFGFSDTASALAGGACHVAAACLVFLLGRRWFGVPAALSAAALYLLSAPILEFSISGMTEPLAALLMLIWVFSLTAPVRALPWGALFSGLALGIFYLARYNAILFLLPGTVWMAWRARRELAGAFAAQAWRRASPRGRRRLGAGLAAAALFLGGFLIAASPWLVRNQLVAGSPFFSLQKYEIAMFTKTYPGYRLYMIPERVDVARFLTEHRDEVLEKFLGNLAEFRRHFLWREFTGFPLRVFACSLLAFVLPFDRFFPGQRGVRPLLVACFLLQLAALLFLHYIPRLFVIFSPFYALYAAGAIWFIVGWLFGLWGESAAAFAHRPPGGLSDGRGRLRRWLFTAASAAIMAGFTFCGAAANLPDFHPDFGPHPTALWGDALRDVRELVSPDEVVVSDNGQVFAWYGERFSCKLPCSPGLLPEVARLAPVRALFLTSWITWAQPDADPAWVAVFKERPADIAGFRLQKVYPDGSLLYLRQLPGEAVRSSAGESS